MPHIILEIPQQLAEKKDLQLLLKTLHHTIGAFNFVELADLKSRIYIINQFEVADGTEAAGFFIHARVMQTKARSDENRQIVSKAVACVLKDFFSEIKLGYPIQLCVENTDIEPEAYLKTIL